MAKHPSAKDSSKKLQLADKGRNAAKNIIRKHRLWESYLVDRAGFRADHVHDRAEKLEHFSETQNILQSVDKTLDPHGKIIP